MNTNLKSTPLLAASITKAASSQTFYTIRFLVDRERVADAYRAYAYFRWVDDCLDVESAAEEERSGFVQRQKSLLERCYRGESIADVNPQEQMLVELTRNDAEKNSGLRSYLFNMMAVMAFDAERRGRLISQSELNQYTRWLSVAVTEAMHYFIGHDCYAPRDETRMLAVAAAHITHMLRDTFDDVQAGYFNIPLEILEASHVTPQDVRSDAYRAWVRGRVQLARSYFEAGRDYLNRVANPRCRLAGYAYMARFEWLLDTIEREEFVLRPAYDERKSLKTGLKMARLALASTLHWRGGSAAPQPVPAPTRSGRRT
ncbi:MAG: squalene/phytoene synthase family protein [Chloroflexi bacterium]|nr:squalene/phytoene synthase family protein [Chloroflexota bacterium]